MRKFVTLERKPGEKIRAYWCRFEAFYEDNHIRKDDKLKVDDAKAKESDKLSRYGSGSELVLCLHMAHKQLPIKLANILSTKLKQNDVTSMKDIILDKAQDVLDEFEGSTSVNRMNYRPQQGRPQYSGNNQFIDNRQSFRQDLRSGGAARQRTPSPPRRPRTQKTTATSA